MGIGFRLGSGRFSCEQSRDMVDKYLRGMQNGIGLFRRVKHYIPESVQARPNSIGNSTHGTAYGRNKNSQKPTTSAHSPA